MSADAVAKTYSTAVEEATETLSSGFFTLLSPAPVHQTTGAPLYVPDTEAAIGYGSLAKLNEHLAEEVLPAASESWPNW